jgi:acyl-CoA dehydrogenase
MIMAANPAEVLLLPRPAWAGEDVATAYDMARRFLEAEIAPHYDGYEKNGIVGQSAWKA